MEFVSRLKLLINQKTGANQVQADEIEYGIFSCLATSFLVESLSNSTIYTSYDTIP
jgi:hypothetical protein